MRVWLPITVLDILSCRLLSETDEMRFGYLRQVIASPRKCVKKHMGKTYYDFPKPVWSKNKVLTPDPEKIVKEEPE